MKLSDLPRVSQLNVAMLYIKFSFIDTENRLMIARGKRVKGIRGANL